MVPVFDRRKLRPLILALAIALCAFQLTTCTGMWLLDPLIVRATHVGLVLSMLFLWRSSNRALRRTPARTGMVVPVRHPHDRHERRGCGVHHHKLLLHSGQDATHRRADGMGSVLGCRAHHRHP
ncbi:MAG: hypothetical protein ACLR0N_06645 [Bilophila wadsworthia]